MGKKILLADDSLTIQKVVELTLSGTEYELTCVSNGQKALESIARSRPDLILADAVMPEKNGYEVCEAVKGNRSTARIPVVLLSGVFEPFDRERAERIGADLVVSKPFDAQQLLDRIEGLLGRAAAAPPPEDEEAPFETPPAAEEPASPPSPEPGPFGAAAGIEDLAAEEPSEPAIRPTFEAMRFESASAEVEPEEPMPPLPQPPPEGFGADGSIDLSIDDLTAEDADALFEGSLAPVGPAPVEPVRAPLTPPPPAVPEPAPPQAAPPAPIPVELTDEQIERIAARVVEKLSDRIVREIAWEVVPDMAEIAVKRRIAELESGTE